MGRNTSLNYEIQMDNKTYFPNTVAEYASGGEEGRIDATDGDVKYKIRDGVRVIDEIPIAFSLKKTQNEHIDDFKAWAKAKSTKDVFVIGRDAGGNTVVNDMFEDCECIQGKRNAFDRAAKAQDMVTFILVPKDIAPVE